MYLVRPQCNNTTVLLCETAQERGVSGRYSFILILKCKKYGIQLIFMRDFEVA